MKTINAKEMMKEYDTMSLNAVGFAKWIGERMSIDSWFKYDAKLNKWYIHTKGDLTTDQLYNMYMNEKNKHLIHK